MKNKRVSFDGSRQESDMLRSMDCGGGIQMVVERTRVREVRSKVITIIRVRDDREQQ